MTEIYTDNGALVTWSTPQCPFVIEYSRKALDDIRLAVVDAFFSLPRGGAEIGGILLGRFEGQRLQILDYAPIECEHAFGPAFTLSPADQTRLGELLQQSFPGAQRPVGWYHSHTRSEIALCEADLDIHNRYFPEPWQVALVLKPSTLQPTQAGFFFREPDGSIHAQRSYQEFVVEALPLQPVPASGQPVRGPMRETEAGAVVLTLPPAETPAAPNAAEPQVPAPQLPAPQAPVSEAVPQAALIPEAGPEPAAEPIHQPANTPAPSESAVSFRVFDSQVDPPHAATPPIPEKPAPVAEAPVFSSYAKEPHEPQRRWLGIAAALVAGLALGVLADQARSHSQPPVAVQAAPVRPAAGSKRESPASADAALRKRAEELTRQVADLTQQNGTLRKENLELTKQQADFAKQQGEAGKQQSDLRQQRDDLLKQTAKLKTDLTAQATRVQSLQQQLDDLRRQQQRRRLSIQSSDPLP